MSKIIEQQTDETWSQLYSRLLEGGILEDKILSENLFDFLNSTSTGNGTNIGYVLASVLTTINFILASKKSKCMIRDGFTINLNTMWIFVGQPNTGMQFLRFFIFYALFNNLKKIFFPIVLLNIRQS